MVLRDKARVCLVVLGFVTSVDGRLYRRNPEYLYDDPSGYCNSNFYWSSFLPPLTHDSLSQPAARRHGEPALLLATATLVSKPEPGNVPLARGVLPWEVPGQPDQPGCTWLYGLVGAVSQGPQAGEGALEEGEHTHKTVDQAEEPSEKSEGEVQAGPQTDLQTDVCTSADAKGSQTAERSSGQSKARGLNESRKGVPRVASRSFEPDRRV